MAAMGASEIQGREAVGIFRRKMGIADFTPKLSLITVVLIQVDGRRFAAGAGAGLRDIALGSALDGFQELSVTILIVSQKIVPFPVL